MSTRSINFKSFVEYDTNPLILFDSSGKVVYLNNSAESLFGYIDYIELFKLALEYAPKSYGFRTAAIALHYEPFHFHSIMVGYEDEEHLALRLYALPLGIKEHQDRTSSQNEVDLNLLLEASLALFSSTSPQTQITLFADMDLPAILTDANAASKLFSMTLASFEGAKELSVELKMIIGEYIFIKKKQYPLILFKVTCKGNTKTIDGSIVEIAKRLHIKLLYEKNLFKMEIPLITHRNKNGCRID